MIPCEENIDVYTRDILYIYIYIYIYNRKAFCLTNVGPQLWNNLNINLKYNNNPNKFNKNYKKYLISLYKD